ncbi:unnamed protein product [Dracunculus medinensis]|uniref:Uncharacterized protein n=1 Tax=Dracunculus medinensis TaxID=318479 RepID=A0A0N4UFY2_DRAME|nr:unnamed protein product [Dracunculus medinensis]
MEHLNLNGADQAAIMDLITELSGIKDLIIANIANMKLLRVIRSIDFEDEIFQANVRLEKAFTNLKNGLNSEQKTDLDVSGFALLQPNQMNELLQAHGVNDPKKIELDIQAYSGLNKHECIENIWRSIKKIALGEKELKRVKRFTIFKKPGIFALSPFIFSPGTGLTVLGPVILSPNVFSPNILSPAVFSPLIFDPDVLGPFILSPYVLSPHILSPLILAPFVLTPYALSPRTVSPYVLSPLVLSPYILSPTILSPQALGGFFLSPRMLSPAIISDQFLSLNVLSPTFLS